ncbi:polysaccharide deacetylase family protein [Lentibacillus cibarius]|uniref:Polysaccharide deacetylase n=1 Tax=Lentibacillus cibarius TaxID=2583219 RepID=A0A5S3R7X7_9BACI|nr:polysaccharide deacetylase family protein [Lentibacillus cibarius]TMN22973.1 polysaccharide deacetylase [Lentibacillus cibarius]
MNGRKRLNRLGKITILSLVTLAIVVVMGIIGLMKNKAAGQEESEVSATRVSQLAVSSAQKEKYSDSVLHETILQKKEQERKEALAKKREKQHHEDQQEKAIYLTFDDGPSPASDQLLNILNQYNAKATFFTLGPNIKKYPEAVKRMVDEGYSVGLHGMTHRVREVYASQAAPVNEMVENQRILQEVADIVTNLVRTPYGSVPYLTEEMRDSLHQNGFKLWDWNVDSKDWELKNKRYVTHTINKIEEMERSNKIPVVLLHDKPATIKYLPELLSYLDQKGYKTKKITNELVSLTFPCAGRCRPVS